MKKNLDICKILHGIPKVHILFLSRELSIFITEKKRGHADRKACSLRIPPFLLSYSPRRGATRNGCIRRLQRMITSQTDWRSKRHLSGNLKLELESSTSCFCKMALFNRRTSSTDVRTNLTGLNTEGGKDAAYVSIFCRVANAFQIDKYYTWKDPEF